MKAGSSNGASLVEGCGRELRPLRSAGGGVRRLRPPHRPRRRDPMESAGRDRRLRCLRRHRRQALGHAHRRHHRGDPRGAHRCGNVALHPPPPAGVVSGVNCLAISPSTAFVLGESLFTTKARRAQRKKEDKASGSYQFTGLCALCAFVVTSSSYSHQVVWAEDVAFSSMKVRRRLVKGS